MNFNQVNKDRKQRRKQPEMHDLVFGKIPPQARELEDAVLGAIMLEKGAFDIVVEKLKPESFYVDANQRIFSAMMSLAQKSLPIDLLTVVQELMKREELEIVGGAFYVSKLTNSVVSSANIEAHAGIISQKFMARELIRIGGEVITDAYEDTEDIFDQMDHLESQVMAVSLNYMRKDFRSIDKGVMAVVKQMDAMQNQDDGLSGVPTGFPRLDRLTHGWQPTDLIILAARPSVGKTAFALNLARNAVMDPFKPTPIGFFSLEMSETQLVQRMLSAESEVYLENIKRSRLDEQRMKQLYTKGIDPLLKAPIFIDDTAALNIFELRSKARRMKQKHNVGLIIIDYLQLMTGEGKPGNREQEISSISRNLKKLAKDLEIPIIALSQLSRDVEKRGSGQKVPQLSDLRESGAIEQDADVVGFIYRPPKDEVLQNPALEGTGMIRIAKHRNGDLDDVPMKFYGRIQKWLDPDAAERFENGMGSNWISFPSDRESKDFSEPIKSNNDDLPF